MQSKFVRTKNLGKSTLNQSFKSLQYRLDNSISNCELEERKGEPGSGEPLPVAASVSSTVIRCQRLVLESVIPVLAFVTISATGEDECTDTNATTTRPIITPQVHVGTSPRRLHRQSHQLLHTHTVRILFTRSVTVDSWSTRCQYLEERCPCWTCHHKVLRRSSRS